MKKIICLLAVMSILSCPVLAQTLNIVSTSSGTVFIGTSHLSVNLVKQDPLSADPGAYVDLFFKIENNGTERAENVTLELVPEYPFSLEPSVNAVVNLGTMNGLQSGNNAFLVKYKVRVDGNAVNGENEIKLRYSEGDGSPNIVNTFNVSVSNPRTDFDVIAQDSTTLAIANIGGNMASAVIVRIPSQQNFRVNGASASIIGNLNAGDYTLVTFEISPTYNSTRGNFTRDVDDNDLIVEISYTDNLGIRRTVDKNVPFSFSSNTTTTGQSFQRIGQSQAFSSNGLLYIVIGVVGIVAIVVFIKLRTRKKK